MSSFYSFVPASATKLLCSWVNELNVKIKISKPRKTKLGDFKVRDNILFITVNNNLNKYSFLITLTHELAHAFVFKKHQYTDSPHGKIWQLTFKSLMLNFLSPECFPEDILKVLSRHMICPKASTFSDLALLKVLKKYDNVNTYIVLDLADGDMFRISNGKTFIKMGKRRTRYECIESKTNKVYLFHPFAEVIKIK